MGILESKKIDYITFFGFILLCLLLYHQREYILCLYVLISSTIFYKISTVLTNNASRMENVKSRLKKVEYNQQTIFAKHYGINPEELIDKEPISGKIIK